MAVIIRKARVQDVKGIHRLLINSRDHDALVLPRSLNELYSRLRDFVVADEDGAVVGCCALSLTWEDLAEVRSLVVGKECRGRGLGRKLIDAVLSEAVTIGIYKVFTLTEQTVFFEKMGFSKTDMSNLNQKVWQDCLNCPRFPDLCNEVAMIIEL